MIDHLLSFADEATAQAALPSYGALDETGAWVWSPSYVLPCVAYTGPQQFDADGTPIGTRPQAPGFWLWVAESTVNPDLQASLDCVLICDRDKADQGAAAILYRRADVSDTDLSTYSIAPVQMGGNYTLT